MRRKEPLKKKRGCALPAGIGESTRLPELEVADAAFRRSCLTNRVDPATAESYERKTKEMVLLTGMPLGYACMLRYLRLREGKVTVAYLRTYKSALCFVMSLAGRPLNYIESFDLDSVMQGLEASEPVRAVRGALTEGMVEQVALRAYRDGLAMYGQGVIVGYGVACRPRDIGELAACRVDLTTGTVRVRAKRCRYLRRKLGEWETHPVMTAGALALLRARCLLHPVGPIFPEWKEEIVRDLIKVSATAGKWDPELIWDGPHTLRHGAATDAMAKALAATQKVGGWTTSSSAAHYSRPNADRKRPRE